MFLIIKYAFCKMNSKISCSTYNPTKFSNVFQRSRYSEFKYIFPIILFNKFDLGKDQPAG